MMTRGVMVKMHTHRIKTNGTELQVYEHSQTGEAILFLHPGLYAGALCWSTVVPFFTKHYRVLTLDLRSYGRSEQQETGNDLYNLAEDVVGVLDALGIDKAHIVGNSLGSEVGVCLADQHGDRVLSFVTLDGALLNYIGRDSEREGTKEEIVASFLQRTLPEYDSQEEFVVAQRESWTPWNEARQIIFEKMRLRPLPNGRFSDRTTTSVLAQGIASLCDLHFDDIYPRLRCPILFLPAEKEPKLAEKLAMIERHSALMSASRKTVVIPGTEHLMMLDHAQELSAEIHTFLREVAEMAPFE
jgi:pimeloyl-ACP methyl ester carboxylesterase